MTQRKAQELVQIATLLLMATLVGCGTTDTSVSAKPQSDIAAPPAELGLSPDDVVHFAIGRFAVTDWGARHGRFFTGYYVQTRKEVRLYETSKAGDASKVYISFPIDKIQHVAVLTWGMFSSAHQLQITTGNKLVVVALGDHPEPSSGRLPLLQAAHGSLRQAGVKNGVATTRVIPDWYANIRVPIVVPR